MTQLVKKYCFTLNNYTELEEDYIKSFIVMKAIYAVIGHEVGTEGTPHLQGFINLKRNCRFSTVKKIMPRAHIEKAEGTDEQNLAYCSKQDANPFVFGEPQRRGKRNDLRSVCDDIASGATKQDVLSAYPHVFVRYPRGISELIELNQAPRDPNEKGVVMWIWGASGVGKTRYAFDIFGVEQVYIKDGTQWWNGYSHQHCVLIDDFDGKWPFRDLLRLLDRYPYQGQSKGGYITINSKIIIITCEYPPEHFWEKNELDQIKRRITDVVEMKAKP